MIEIAKVGLKDFSRSAKILILTNLIYAFVMPVIDIFYQWFPEQNKYQKVILARNVVLSGVFNCVYEVFKNYPLNFLKMCE